MRILACWIIGALLAGCQTTPRADATRQPEGLAFEVKSWGALVHGWSVAGDGSATSVKRISASGSPWPPYTIEHRRFTLAPEALAKLRGLAGEIPRPVPTDQNCENRITDAAYGTLTLVDGDNTEELAFYGGCFDAYYAPFLGKVKAIDALVMGVSEQAPVESREQVTAQTD